MDKKEFLALDRVVQDQLASKYGITRSGENNQEVTAEDLAKIPVTKKPKEETNVEEPKKESRKPAVKKVSKRSNNRRTTKKSKSSKK